MTVNEPRFGAHRQGFTLIELVVVLVIAGILASVVWPHFFDTATFSQRAYADEIASALRLAQKAAVASDCPAEVIVTAAGYAVVQQGAAGNTCNPSDTGWGTPVVALDGAAAQDSAPANIRVSPTGSYLFTGGGALGSAPATSMSVGNYTITIDATTGLVQVQAP